MKVVIWARVSSREQREGYSIDAQLRFTREKAAREGWEVVREFVAAESAKRGAERQAFNEMFAWVRKNARRERIDAILSHKLDRVCRNMRDAVRMQELEDTCGVQLAFVDNQFGPGAAGALSFNVMAAVAQYYSDNLRSEVLKGMEEKVKQGWLPGCAPYGYRNVPGNREEPIQIDPEQSKAVLRIFEVYARGNSTFKMLEEQLLREGYVYRPSAPRFTRTALSYILNNRFYLGEIVWHGRTLPGKHKPLITHRQFEACQDVLKGKNRRTSNRSHPLASGLLHCAYCGSVITGELIRRKLKDGSVREHLYYRCANNNPDHPTVRWKAEALDEAIHADLGKLKLDEEEANWVRESLAAYFADASETQARTRQTLMKKHTELTQMKERLLGVYLSGALDAVTFETKNTDLQTQLKEVETSLGACGDIASACGDKVISLFDRSQHAADRWQRSKMREKRAIVEEYSLNRMLGDATLAVQKRKPFDVLAKRPSCVSGRGDRI